jgi:hypothetical protein
MNDGFRENIEMEICKAGAKMSERNNIFIYKFN